MSYLMKATHGTPCSIRSECSRQAFQCRFFIKFVVFQDSKCFGCAVSFAAHVTLVAFVIAFRENIFFNKLVETIAALCGTFRWRLSTWPHALVWLSKYLKKHLHSMWNLKWISLPYRSDETQNYNSWNHPHWFLWWANMEMSILLYSNCACHWV